VLTRYEGRVTGEQMRYLRKCTWKTGGDKIRSSQIRGIFNQELVTKMVDNKKLRWFGHLIRMDSNMKLRQVRETRVELTWGRGRPRIEWEEHMRKVRREKKGKTLQETKEKKAFRIWVMQLDAWEGPQRVRRR
jgi:hypothetical protein